jgi:hypothetical protein
MPVAFGRAKPRTGAAWLAAAALLGCGACGDGGDATRAPASSPAGADESGDATGGGVCAGARTLTCTYFDGATGAWSTTPPAQVSLAAACAPGASHGEIDAYVDTRAQYWLDSVGFRATGSAVRVTQLGANDAVGGVTYGCGQGGGPVLTKLFCGQDVGPGALALRFAFTGHWDDGTQWTQECDAQVDVVP